MLWKSPDYDYCIVFLRLIYKMPLTVMTSQ